VLVRGISKHVAAYARDFLFQEGQLRQPISTLSGGERNRLLLARALAKPANMLVLDEPTNDLDMDTLDKLEELLETYDGTLILVSHDRDFVDRLATSTIAMNGRGDIVETPGGWTDFIRQNPGFLQGRTRDEDEDADRRRQRPPPPSPPAKLTFKDAHRLKGAEGLYSPPPTTSPATTPPRPTRPLRPRSPSTQRRSRPRPANGGGGMAGARAKWRPGA
jgi:ATP-binding cassette subfamily F protein uup